MAGRLVRRLPVVIALFAFASSAAAQAGSIVGKITDGATGAAIAGANVQAVSGTRAAATNVSGADGTYRLTDLPAGTYTVVASKIGFTQMRAEGIAVTGSGSTTSNFAMIEFATQLNPVVTTSTRGVTAEKVLDAPASISVISGDEIANKPSATIADFMKTVPGVSVSTGGLVQSNIVSRGFNNAFSGQMLVMQDYRFAGVPSLRVNVPFLFTSTTEDIDHIEVLNGPASALYGPNSANGVLHIITKSPFDSKGTTLTIDGGSRSLFRGSVRNAGTFGDDKWGYKISGEYFTGTDWPYTDPNEPTVFPAAPGTPAARVNQPNVRDENVGRYAGEARLDFRPDANLENTFTAGYSKILSAIDITTAFGAAQVKNWSFSDFQDRFRYKRFFAQVFYNQNNSGNSSPDDLSGTYYLRTGIPVVDKSTVLVGQVQQGFDILSSKWTAGFDYIGTKPRSEGSIYGRNEGSTDITESGAYVQSTIPLADKLDLVSAFRGDYTDRLAGLAFSPQVAFVYKPNPTNDFRFTFSRAFNSPASFEYFLDQVSNPTAAPGFALRAIGNPAKEGWQFNRGCDATVNGGLCMHSPWVAQGPTVAVSSTAASAFPGFIAALPSVINGLPSLTATQRGQLLGLLQQLNPILSSLHPTASQIGTNLSLSGQTVLPSAVTDIAPLSASFNNTWELGYKGILGDRLRVAVDLCYQIRGDVGAPIGQANPLVLYEPNSLGNYLVTNITAGLMQSGVPQAQALATAQQAAGALVPVMAQLPQGTVAFTNTKLANDQSIIATYQNGQGQIDVHGMDLAADYQLNDEWILAATVSVQDRIVFENIGGPGNPLMSNTPKNRASFTTHYANEGSGWSFETALRWSDAFPVNSGLLTSIAPNPNGGATYPSVPSSVQIDLGFSYRLPIAQKITWSLNVSNVLNDQVATFVGVPPIGRMAITRIKYDF